MTQIDKSDTEHGGGVALMKALLFAIFLVLVFSGSSFAESTLSLNTADSSPYSKADNSGFYDVLLSKTFKKLGIEISINHLPSERSIFNVNAGIDDGEFARIKGIEKIYDGIVLVEEELISFGFTAFSKDVSLEINEWEDLEKYNVAYINGWKIYENNVMAYKSLVTAKDQQELFNLLVNDRVDLVLYEKWRGIDYLKRTNLVGIHSAPEALLKKGMYLYLNKKHKLLVPEVKKAIQLIKTEGLYDELIKSILRN